MLQTGNAGCCIGVSKGNTYTGEATATLNEGEFVPATGLRLVKQ